MSIFKKLWFSLIAVGIVLISEPGHSAGKRKSYPGFVRLSLAGVNIEHAGVSMIYDPKEHYFLILTGDCDRASTDLILTPKPESWGRHLDQKTPRVSLPRIRSDKGVNIGESPWQVQHKLGRAPHFRSYDSQTKKRTYTYRADLGNNWTYRGNYVFYNERLWEISYNIAHSDSC